MKKLEVRIADLDERGFSAPDGEVNALLQELKDEKYKNEWFRSPVIRDFLNEHVVSSGAVPDCIIEAVEDSNQEMEDRGLGRGPDALCRATSSLRRKRRISPL